MIRGKKENLFGSVPWANRYNLRFCRIFGRTILITSGVSKKTLTKSHDYSRLFSQAKRRLKKALNVVSLTFLTMMESPWCLKGFEKSMTCALSLSMVKGATARSASPETSSPTTPVHTLVLPPS